MPIGAWPNIAFTRPRIGRRSGSAPAEVTKVFPPAIPQPQGTPRERSRRHTLGEVEVPVAQRIVGPTRIPHRRLEKTDTCSAGTGASPERRRDPAVVASRAHRV